MTHPANQSPPADVCLLLRAHAEARWLSHEVVPVIRELEHDFSSHAGLTSYLETLRIDARRHAAQTEAVRIELDALPPNGNHALHNNARRYHSAVRRLRTTVDRRAQRLLAGAADEPGDPHSAQAPARNSNGALGAPALNRATRHG
jgi:hypothetical protein